MFAFVLQDILVEMVVPHSAIYRPSDLYVMHNAEAMSDLESGKAYAGVDDLFLPSGSRPEGLALEDDWGHEAADWDQMWLEGGTLGVFVPDGHPERGQSCLTFSPEGCRPAFTKLEIWDLSGLQKDWWHESCVYEAGGLQLLDTYNTVRRIMDTIDKGQPVSGPAGQRGVKDYVTTLVCSGPHPDLQQEFQLRPRGQWPPTSLIDEIIKLPMLLVLVGHKHSPESRLEARISWSHLEIKLIQELPETLRQGYIACKYTLKRFLAAHRGKHGTDDGEGRSKLCSYHIKTALLHYLEKRPPLLITSPFQLFLDLLNELQGYLDVGKLPHYFVLQCNLLETVGDNERHIACRAIRDILSDPLDALLTSPICPQQIYGQVRPNDLVVTFRRFSAHPRFKRNRNDVSELLTQVDEWRYQRYREQCRKDNDRYWILRVSGRPEVTSLVDMLNQIQ